MDCSVPKEFVCETSSANRTIICGMELVTRDPFSSACKDTSPGRQTEREGEGGGSGIRIQSVRQNCDQFLFTRWKQAAMRKLVDVPGIPGNQPT